jgi:CTP synthase (UTP-ammonia lyase)
MEQLLIGIVGDQNPEVRSHRVVRGALRQAAESIGKAVEVRWFPTDSLAADVGPQLRSCHGIWCVPGSPYDDMDGALRAIRFARLEPKPFLGTCGGFQHAVLEYARSVLGWTDADHAESNPEAGRPVIAPLSCSLVGRSGPIHVDPLSRIGRIYGRPDSVERYHCNYGLRDDYRTALHDAGLRVSAWDADGAVRAVEIPDHLFFIATLFQPELSWSPASPHPVIGAFVAAASAYQGNSSGHGKGC